MTVGFPQFVKLLTNAQRAARPPQPDMPPTMHVADKASATCSRHGQSRPTFAAVASQNQLEQPSVTLVTRYPSVTVKGDRVIHNVHRKLRPDHVDD